MAVFCQNCKDEIKDSGAFNCDICLGKVHKECSNLTASEIKCMLLKNRVLKFVCCNCSMKISDAATMYKLIFEISNELKEVKNQMKELKNIVMKTNLDDKKEKTYADALVNKDVVIVQPKEGQSLQKTKETLIKEVSPKEIAVGISQVKSLKNGGVAISCNNKEEISKLKNEVENKLGSRYKVSVPELLKPRIKIVGMSQLLDKEELIDSIIKQNKGLNILKEDFQIICIKQMKKRYMAIAELNGETYGHIMDNKILNIGWDTCNVYEHFNVKRCFKCGRYNHKMSDCKNSEICFKCGDGSHKTTECINRNLSCVNCKEANEKLKLNLNINHTVFDIHCPTYLRQVEVIKSKIKYT